MWLFEQVYNNVLDFCYEGHTFGIRNTISHSQESIITFDTIQSFIRVIHAILRLFLVIYLFTFVVEVPLRIGTILEY